jgi:hypothetical protein
MKLHTTAIHEKNYPFPMTSAVPVGLGTPAQQFNLAIDTGSPVTWVVENTCISRMCSQVSHRFNCAASS